MSLLLGPMHHHIPGHKDLSEHGEILEVKAGKQVFIPLYASHSTKFDILVKEGDHVCVGTLLAKCSDRMVIPIYSSVSGTVTGISKIMHMTLKPVDHIVIENDGKMETKPPFHPLDYQKASREELIAFMKDAGMTIVSQDELDMDAFYASASEMIDSKYKSNAVYSEIISDVTATFGY